MPVVQVPGQVAAAAAAAVVVSAEVTAGPAALQRLEQEAVVAALQVADIYLQEYPKENVY